MFFKNLSYKSSYTHTHKSVGHADVADYSLGNVQGRQVRSLCVCSCIRISKLLAQKGKVILYSASSIVRAKVGYKLRSEVYTVIRVPLNIWCSRHGV
jgi:hypothetical protein